MVTGTSSAGLAQMQNDGLAQMLAHHTNLSHLEWEGFGIPDLGTHHHVLCNGRHPTSLSANSSSSEYGTRGWWGTRRLV